MEQKKIFVINGMGGYGQDIPIITSNTSDLEVENYCYDYIIDNDGNLEKLRKQARDPKEVST